MLEGWLCQAALTACSLCTHAGDRRSIMASAARLVGAVSEYGAAPEIRAAFSLPAALLRRCIDIGSWETSEFQLRQLVSSLLAVRGWSEEPAHC